MKKLTHAFLALCLLAASGKSSAFDPEAEATIFLFSHACLNLYPSGDDAINSWLTNSGIKELPKTEATRYTFSNNGRAFAVNSMKQFILALEDDNLCSVFVDNVDQSNTLSMWEKLRQGLASENVSESIKETGSGSSVSKHYTYTDKSKKLIMRITISTKDSKAEKTDFALSVVSKMRENNK